MCFTCPCLRATNPNYLMCWYSDMRAGFKPVKDNSCQVFVLETFSLHSSSQIIINIKSDRLEGTNST